MARIPCADPDRPEATDPVARSAAERGGVNHLHVMPSHSPPVAGGQLRCLTAIHRRCDLPGHSRELVILQVVHLNGGAFEAEQHTPIALRDGLSQTQVDALPAWRSCDAFGPAQRAALAYRDAITLNVHVPAEVFAASRAQFDPRAIIELTATVEA